MMCFGGSSYTPTAQDAPPPAPTPIDTTGEIQNKNALSNLNANKFGRNSLLIQRLLSSTQQQQSQTNLPTSTGSNTTGTNL